MSFYFQLIPISEFVLALLNCFLPVIRRWSLIKSSCNITKLSIEEGGKSKQMFMPRLLSVRGVAGLGAWMGE